MPLYVYSCPECDIVLEELRLLAQADDPVECPICHGLCVREPSRFSNPVPIQPVYASPQQVARVLHGPDCSCCNPRLRRR